MEPTQLSVQSPQLAAVAEQAKTRPVLAVRQETVVLVVALQRSREQPSPVELAQQIKVSQVEARPKYKAITVPAAVEHPLEVKVEHQGLTEVGTVALASRRPLLEHR